MASTTFVQDIFHARFKVFMEVKIEVDVFWIVTVECHNTTRRHNPDDRDISPPLTCTWRVLHNTSTNLPDFDKITNIIKVPINCAPSKALANFLRPFRHLSGIRSV
jgi:hypothetical protein